MLARVAMPAVRQKRSKRAPTSCQASSMVATGTTAAVVGSFMALLSFVDSAPRAYRLKVGNACPPISTSTGTSPISVKEERNMFGLCRDPLVAELQNLGFSLVPLADASIRPLELLGRQGKELFRFGELSKLF